MNKEWILAAATLWGAHAWAQSAVINVQPAPIVTSPAPVVIQQPPVMVAPPLGVIVPPGVVYVAPTYPTPGMGFVWEYHPRYGWGWRHPHRGWHRGWR